MRETELLSVTSTCPPACHSETLQSVFTRLTARSQSSKKTSARYHHLPKNMKTKYCFLGGLTTTAAQDASGRSGSQGTATFCCPFFQRVWQCLLEVLDTLFVLRVRILWSSSHDLLELASILQLVRQAYEIIHQLVQALHVS